MSVCVCVCLCMEGGDSWLRLRGGMGATFCHLAALRSAIESLFWDDWETAVLGQILAGRSREVTGANFCHLAASWPPIEFLFWDHSETAVLSQILAGGKVTGGHGRSWEVTGGYGHGGGKPRKAEERQSVNWRVWSVECKVWSMECKVCCEE